MKEEPTPPEIEADIQAAQEVLRRHMGGGGLAMLTTVSTYGKPHATWMSTVGSIEVGEVVTITSPDSDKAANIRVHPQVEWLFTSDDRRHLVYLEGVAEIVEDPSEIKRLWGAIPNKHQAYFLQFFNSGIGFAIIKTKVEAAIFCVPSECRKASIPVGVLDASSS